MLRINKTVLVAFIAFIVGQAIQIIANAVAVILYAYRPLLWCGFVAIVTIILVLMTITVSSMSEYAMGEHQKRYDPMEEVEKYATPPEA